MNFIVLEGVMRMIDLFQLLDELNVPTTKSTIVSIPRPGNEKKINSIQLELDLDFESDK